MNCKTEKVKRLSIKTDYIREQYLGDGLREQLGTIKAWMQPVAGKETEEHLIIWTLCIFQEIKPPMLLFPDEG